MKKILISLSVIGVVAAAAIGGTIAYFSDTETSTGNTFTAGTIDISVDDMNPWNKTFTLADMKPSYTDYINFEIQNIGSDPNPVDVWKKIIVTSETTGAQSEPECTEEVGVWANNACTGMTMAEGIRDNLSAAIWYDLYVEVWDGNNKIWWQTIYGDGGLQTIDSVYNAAGEKGVYLGMIPANGKMKVKQSYHLATQTGNWAQGDKMTFDIILNAKQIEGIAVLENKTGDPDWKIIDDVYKGTLTYKVKNPTFDFSFTGKAPLANHNYVLAAGWKANGAGFDVGTKLGSKATDSNGDITITGNINTGDMKNVKVWLVPAEDWNDSTGMTWASWPTITGFLWETGLIWYDDTNN